MRELLSLETDRGLVARLVHTSKLDGDLSPTQVEPSELRSRREPITGTRPWHVVRQIHGATVLDATLATPIEIADARPVADAVVIDRPGEVVAIHTGDCVPVGFAHPSGVVAVAHAGWKGLEAGVLAATARAVRERFTEADDKRPIFAVVGPHIHAPRYEFGRPDLERLIARFGPTVESMTTDGRPALDLSAATKGELARLGVHIVHVSPDCTAALVDQYWSHRARQESGRIAIAAWLDTE